MKKIGIIIVIILGFFLKIDYIIAIEKMSVTLSNCVDGDTAWFSINGERIKTRFLAIDTPESTNQVEEYGKEAGNYTCSLLENAKEIELSYDENSSKTDKYNRHLVWVFVDDKLLQQLIIQNGYGEVAYLYGNYSYTESLKDYELEAKTNKVGMWADYKVDYTNLILIILFVIIALLTKTFSTSKLKKYIRIIKKI